MQKIWVVRNKLYNVRSHYMAVSRLLFRSLPVENANSRLEIPFVKGNWMQFCARENQLPIRIRIKSAFTPLSWREIKFTDLYELRKEFYYYL